MQPGEERKVSPKRVNVLGVPVDCVDMSQSLAVVDAMIAGDHPATIVAVNPEKVMKARQDPALAPFPLELRVADPRRDRRSLRRAAAREAAYRARFPALSSCRRSAPAPLSVVTRCSSSGPTRRSTGAPPRFWCRRIPGLRIVGRHHGFVDEAGMPRVIEQINACRPDVLFVALGSPKQEIVAREVSAAAEGQGVPGSRRHL